MPCHIVVSSSPVRWNDLQLSRFCPENKLFSTYFIFFYIFIYDNFNFLSKQIHKKWISCICCKSQYPSSFSYIFNRDKFKMNLLDHLTFHLTGVTFLKCGCFSLKKTKQHSLLQMINQQKWIMKITSRFYIILTEQLF